METCWQCHERVTRTESDYLLYCGSCGAFLGEFTNESGVIAMDNNTPANSKDTPFRNIFKTPVYMWPDEFLHTYTKWHNNENGLTKKYCNWVDKKLLKGVK